MHTLLAFSLGWSYEKYNERNKKERKYIFLYSMDIDIEENTEKSPQ